MDTFLYELFTDKTYGPGYLFLCSRSAFLLGTDPVPVSIRFIEGRKIIELDAIFLFNSLYHVCQETGKVFIMFILQIECTITSGISGKSVLSEINGRGIQESEEFIDSAFLRQPKEVALTFLFIPVITPVRLQETFGTHPGRTNLAGVTLLRAPCTQIEPPQGKTDTFGLPVRVVFSTEQPVGYLFLFLFGPFSYNMHTPGIRSAEMFHHLQGLSGNNPVIYVRTLCTRSTYYCKDQ